MKKCPTCDAAYNDQTECHRCGTPLARLIAIEQEAEHHLEEARQAYDRQDFQAMHDHARRASALRQTFSSEKLLALAALATGNHAAALAAWKRLRVSSSRQN